MAFLIGNCPQRVIYDYCSVNTQLFRSFSSDFRTSVQILIYEITE